MNIYVFCYCLPPVIRRPYRVYHHVWPPGPGPPPVFCFLFLPPARSPRPPGPPTNREIKNTPPRAGWQEAPWMHLQVLRHLPLDVLTADSKNASPAQNTPLSQPGTDGQLQLNRTVAPAPAAVQAQESETEIDTPDHASSRGNYSCIYAALRLTLRLSILSATTTRSAAASTRLLMRLVSERDKHGADFHPLSTLAGFSSL